MALALIYGSVDAIRFWGFQRLSFLFDSFLLPSLQWANVWVEASIAGPPPPLSWWDEGARATLKLWVFGMPCQPLPRAHVLRSPSPIGSLRLADRIQHINFLPTPGRRLSVLHVPAHCPRPTPAPTSLSTKPHGRRRPTRRTMCTAILVSQGSPSTIDY